MRGGPFVGVVIEESLDDRTVLDKLRIVKTETEEVTDEFKTPWLRKWTLRTVEIPAGEVEDVARDISRSLSTAHGSHWYADFKNDSTHYIVFKGRIFVVDRRRREKYAEVTRYGVSLGIPDYQLDFSKDVIG